VFLATDEPCGFRRGQPQARRPLEGHCDMLGDDQPALQLGRAGANAPVFVGVMLTSRLRGVPQCVHDDFLEAMMPVECDATVSAAPTL